MSTPDQRPVTDGGWTDSDVTSPNTPSLRPLADGGPGWATNVPTVDRYTAAAGRYGKPYRVPLADGGPGYAVHYPPGTHPVPVTIRCSRPDCSSALSMPNGTPQVEQEARLLIAGWTKLPDGVVCGATHAPREAPRLAAPASRRAAHASPGRPVPGWAWWSLLVGLYLMFLTAVYMVVLVIDGTLRTFLILALISTAPWWAVLLHWAMKRRRR